MSTFYAWPFLVSRNRILGYRTVVAPSFMVEAENAGLLANEIGSSITLSPVRHVISETEVGPLTVVYRVINATHVNPAYRDEAGRPILWIEGFVLKGDKHDPQITVNDLEQVHPQLKESYSRFWGQNLVDFPTESSGKQSFVDESHEVLSPTPIHPVNESIRSKKPCFPRWSASAVLSTLLIIAVLIISTQSRQLSKLENQVNAMNVQPFDLALDDKNLPEILPPECISNTLDPSAPAKQY